MQHALHATYDAPVVSVVDLFETWCTLRIRDPPMLGFAGKPDRFEVVLSPAVALSGERPAQPRIVTAQRRSDTTDMHFDDLERHGAYDVRVRGVGGVKEGGMPLVGAWTQLHVALVPRVHVAQGEVHHASLHLLLDFGGWAVPTVDTQPIHSEALPSLPSAVNQQSTLNVQDTRTMTHANDARHSQSVDPVGIEGMMHPERVLFHRRQPVHVVKWYEVEIRRTSEWDPKPQRERLSVAYVPNVTSQGGDHVTALEAAKALRGGEAAVFFVRVRACRGVSEDGCGTWSPHTRFVCVPPPVVQLRRIGMNSCAVTWSPMLPDSMFSMASDRREATQERLGDSGISRELRDVSFTCRTATLRTLPGNGSMGKDRPRPPSSSPPSCVTTSHVIVGSHRNVQELEDASLRPREMRLSTLAPDTVYNAEFVFTFAAGGLPTTLRFRFATLPAPEFFIRQSIIGARYAAVSFGCCRRVPAVTTDLQDASFLPDTNDHSLPSAHTVGEYRLVLERHHGVADVLSASPTAAANGEADDSSHCTVGLFHLQALVRGDVACEVTQLNGPSVASILTADSNAAFKELFGALKDNEQASEAFWKGLFVSEVHAADRLLSFAVSRAAVLDGLPAGISFTLRVRCGLLCPLSLAKLRREIPAAAQEGRLESLSALTSLIASMCEFSTWTSTARREADDEATDAVQGSSDVVGHTLSPVESVLEHRTSTELTASLFSRDWVQLERAGHSVRGGSDRGWRPAPLRRLLVTVRRAPRCANELRAWESLERRRNWDDVLNQKQTTMMHGESEASIGIHFLLVDKRSSSLVPVNADERERRRLMEMPQGAGTTEALQCRRRLLEWLPPLPANTTGSDEGHPLAPFVALDTVERFGCTIFSSERVVTLVQLAAATRYEVQWNAQDDAGSWYGPRSAFLDTLPDWSLPIRRVPAPQFAAPPPQIGEALGYAPLIERAHTMPSDAAEQMDLHHPLVASVFRPTIEPERLDTLERHCGQPSGALIAEHRQAALAGGDGDGHRTLQLSEFLASRRRPVDAPASVRVVAVGFDDAVLAWRPISWDDDVSLASSTPTADRGGGRSDVGRAVAATMNEFRIRIEWSPLPHAAVASDRRPGGTTSVSDMEQQHGFRYYFLRTDDSCIRVTRLSTRYFHSMAISVFDKSYGVWSPWSEPVPFTVTSPLRLSLDGVSLGGITVSWRKCVASMDPRVLLTNPVLCEASEVVVEHMDWRSLGSLGDVRACDAEDSAVAGSAGEELCESLDALFGGDQSLAARAAAKEGAPSAVHSSSSGRSSWTHRVPSGTTSLVVPLLLRGVYRCSVRSCYQHGSVSPWSRPQFVFVYPLSVAVQRLESRCIDISWRRFEDATGRGPGELSETAEGGDEPRAADPSDKKQLFLVVESVSAESAFRRVMELPDALSGHVTVQGLTPATEYRIHGVVATMRLPRIPLSISTAVADTEPSAVELPQTANHNTGTTSVTRSLSVDQTIPTAVMPSATSVLRRRLERAVKAFPLCSLSSDKRPPRTVSELTKNTRLRRLRQDSMYGWMNSTPTLTVRTMNDVFPSLLSVGPSHIEISWERVPVAQRKLPCTDPYDGPAAIDEVRTASATGGTLQSSKIQEEVYVVVTRDAAHGDMAIDMVTPTTTAPTVAAGLTTLKKQVPHLQPNGLFTVTVLPFRPSSGGAAAVDGDDVCSLLQSRFIKDGGYRSAGGLLSSRIVVATPSPLRLFAYIHNHQLPPTPTIGMPPSTGTGRVGRMLVVFAARTVPQMLLDKAWGYEAQRSPFEAGEDEGTAPFRVLSGVQLLAAPPAIVATALGDSPLTVRLAAADSDGVSADASAVVEKCHTNGSDADTLLWSAAPLRAPSVDCHRGEASQPLPLLMFSSVSGSTELTIRETAALRVPSHVAALSHSAAVQADDDVPSPADEITTTAATRQQDDTAAKRSHRFDACSPQSALMIPLPDPTALQQTNTSGAKRWVITARQRTWDGTSWGELLRGTIVL